MRHLRTSVLASARSPAPTGAGGGLLPARELAVAWSLILLVVVPAWVLTVGQARDMGVEPGTMGMALPLFLLRGSSGPSTTPETAVKYPTAASTPR
ncbi:hypothetical protein GCM10010256_51050 [Streptomyces coeruleorubidus]|nr:hypothetical protein GCM10010256_51050 [Streptomyces coeruleorubidus]